MTTETALLPQFPTIDRARIVRYAAALFLSVVAAAAAIAAFDFVVDPFQQYRKPSWHAPHFYRTLQRHINPGIAKNYDYDTVITGSSMMENYSNAEAGRILEGRAINLAMGAATAYELRQLLSTIIATGKAKHIVLDMNYNAFAGSPTSQVVGEPLPLYLYDRNPINDLHYLLQWQTLSKSIEIISNSRRSRFSADPDRPWYWADEYPFSKQTVLHGLDLGDINRTYRQSPRTLDAMMASFETNLLPIFRSHPDVRFSLVYPPYSALVWRDFAQRNQLDVTLAFRRRVFEVLRGLPNVALHDFQTRRDWVTNLDNYKDIYHFSPLVSRELLISVARGTDHVDEKRLMDAEPVLRELATFTP